MVKYSILIVDDEDNVSLLLNKVFAKEGYKTFVAGDGQKALDIIGEHHIDIVITDIRMPGISGIELLAKIRELDSSIKVLIMTAFATLETAIEALKMGARDYITKPFNLEDVVSSVKRVLESSEMVELESINVKSESKLLDTFLYSKSSKMSKVVELIKQVADSHATIMIYGETGTGKELAAQTIHSLSPRKEEPFIKVNCSAIPETLLESELFGYEKGAFTGATARKPGRFELADGGSIFLDEIGDITPAIQVKLLRVLQEKEFQPLGSTKTNKVDIRIIAATNKNLEELVRQKLMREDLYYRLNVVPVTLPPLRERKEDIELLVDHFLLKSSFISGKPKKSLSPRALSKLLAYDWPGNIRELENIVERCVVVTPSETIDWADLPEHIRNNEGIGFSDAARCTTIDDAVDSAEREAILKALHECNGNRTKASELLGISRRSLHRKILKYGIED